MKKKVTKKVVKSVKKTSAKKLATRLDLLQKSIDQFKDEYEDWKKLPSDELYGIESFIDANLYEKKYQHIAPGYGDHNRDDRSNDEVILERLTFDAIKMIKGRRHQCDIYYDDAFHGYDDQEEVNEARRKGKL